MAAYLIVHRREIKDSERLKDYAAGINATIARHGGRIMAREDGFEVLEGQWRSGEKGDDSHPERLTVVAFPDMAALRGWYDSTDYAPLKKIRQEAAICDIVAVDGRDA